MFLEGWSAGGVWAVAHFMEGEGNLLEHAAFSHRYQVQCTAAGLKSMVQQDLLHSNVSLVLGQLCIGRTEFCESLEHRSCVYVRSPWFDMQSWLQTHLL